MTRTGIGAMAPLKPSTAAEPSIDKLVVEFPSGIPGFESHRRFVLIASAELSPLGCLKAVDASDVSFLVLDPRLLFFNYDLTLSEFERARIGADAGEPLLWLAIVTITEKEATANLRAPVVINPSKMIGCQLIRDNDQYPVRFAINLG
ncbi:MAG TPA: flagellar assembly protein FliW [Vicinamibacterales bacterium]